MSLSMKMLWSRYPAVLSRFPLKTLQIEFFDHPPYTPDLTPSDYELFSQLKKTLGVAF